MEQAKRYWEEKGKRKGKKNINWRKTTEKNQGENGYKVSETNHPASFFFLVDKMPERFSGCSQGCSNNVAGSILAGSSAPPGGAVPAVITG